MSTMWYSKHAQINPLDLIVLPHLDMFFFKTILWYIHLIFFYSSKIIWGETYSPAGKQFKNFGHQNLIFSCTGDSLVQLLKQLGVNPSIGPLS